MKVLVLSERTHSQRRCSASRAPSSVGRTVRRLRWRFKPNLPAMLRQLGQAIFLTALCYGLISQAQASGQHASSSYTQVVDKADPGLSWETPPSIVYGTALSAAQLSATARVAGNFLYTPALGEVIPEGTQVLSVLFIPDSPNFNPAMAAVQLLVNPPQGVTFMLTTALPSNKQPSVTVLPGADVTLPLNLTPVGSFNETVTFTCTVPENLRCSLDPAMVLPHSASVSILLKIAYPPPTQPGGTDQKPITPPRRPVISAAPGQMAAPLFLGMFCLIGFRYRKSYDLLRRGYAARNALIVTVALIQLMGCGYGPSRTTEKATVIATSTSVRRSLQINISVFE